jgi:dTDP-4-dehydrorhamnose reductase
VVGTRRVDNWRLSGAGIVPCDADDRRTLGRLFDQHGFRAVLNCEGSCKLKSCELDPAMAWRVNVVATSCLLQCVEAHGSYLLHLSVDLVFSGAGAGSYTELDPPDPVTVYGSTMVEAERLIRRRMPRAGILRISLPMGVSFNGHAGAIDWIQSRFRQQRPATLYIDEIRCPTYTDCLNRVMERALIIRLAGLFHAGGPRALSLFQIAQIVNRVGGYDPRLLIGRPRRDAGPVPPRAGNVSLVSDKLIRALGTPVLDPWPLSERWVPKHPQWHIERADDVIGSPELLAAQLYRNPDTATGP